MKQVFWIFCLVLLAGAAQAQIVAPPPPGSVKTTTQTMPVAAAPTTAPTPPTAPTAAVTAPVKPTVTAEPEAGPPPSSQPAPITTLSLAEQFKDQLPFPLDEAKMTAFAEASRKVKQINEKWDVQIAAADTDLRAKEYNTFAVEEITKALDTIPGLTLDQYTAMTKLTATNPDFSQVYMAYKRIAGPRQNQSAGREICDCNTGQTGGQDCNADKFRYCSSASGFAKASVFVTVFPAIVSRTAISEILLLLVRGMSVTAIILAGT